MISNGMAAGKVAPDARLVYAGHNAGARTAWAVLQNMATGTALPTREVLFSVSGLSRRGVFEDVSFELRRGEILGFSGLMGAGRTEVARAIFGADLMDSGSVRLGDQELRIRGPRDACRNSGYAAWTTSLPTRLPLPTAIYRSSVVATLSAFNAGSSAFSEPSTPAWRNALVSSTRPASRVCWRCS